MDSRLGQDRTLRSNGEALAILAICWGEVTHLSKAPAIPPSACGESSSTAWRSALMPIALVPLWAHSSCGIGVRKRPLWRARFQKLARPLAAHVSPLSDAGLKAKRLRQL